MSGRERKDSPRGIVDAFIMWTIAALGLTADVVCSTRKGICVTMDLSQPTGYLSPLARIRAFCKTKTLQHWL